MGHDMNYRNEPRWWRSDRDCRARFSGSGRLFLLTEHIAHVFGVRPYLLIMACPLMHILMHHGNHGADGHAHSGKEDEREEGTTR